MGYIADAIKQGWAEGRARAATRVTRTSRVSGEEAAELLLDLFATVETMEQLEIFSVCLHTMALVGVFGQSISVQDVERAGTNLRLLEPILNVLVDITKEH